MRNKKGVLSVILITALVFSVQILNPSIALAKKKLAPNALFIFDIQSEVEYQAFAKQVFDNGGTVAIVFGNVAAIGRLPVNKQQEILKLNMVIDIHFKNVDLKKVKNQDNYTIEAVNTWNGMLLSASTPNPDVKPDKFNGFKHPKRLTEKESKNIEREALRKKHKKIELKNRNELEAILIVLKLFKDYLMKPQGVLMDSFVETNNTTLTDKIQKWSVEFSTMNVPFADFGFSFDEIKNNSATVYMINEENLPVSKIYIRKKENSWRIYKIKE